MTLTQAEIESIAQACADEICRRLGVAGTSPAPIMKAAGDAFGLRYDGFQKDLGHQFTDEHVTGSSFYVDYPHELEPKLAAMRKKFSK